LSPAAAIKWVTPLRRWRGKPGKKYEIRLRGAPERRPLKYSITAGNKNRHSTQFATPLPPTRKKPSTYN
jgi:hypothetical protein